MVIRGGFCQKSTSVHRVCDTEAVGRSWQELFWRREEEWKRQCSHSGIMGINFPFCLSFSVSERICAIIAHKLVCKKKNQDKELKTERNHRDRR